MSVTHTIHWRVETLDHHPCLARGEPPPGALNAMERARLAALHSAKRRRDWLLGRWTAKRLLQAYLWQTTGRQPPLDQLNIDNNAARAPFAEARDGFGWQTLPVCLSISHSHDRALCALTDTPSWAIGADIERIEPRPAGFAEAYFTPDEAAQVGQAADDRPWLETAIWSLKEAALKALRVGLSVDTQRLACRMEAITRPPENWFPITIHYAGEMPVVMPGWVRRQDGFVLSLVGYAVDTEMERTRPEPLLVPDGAPVTVSIGGER